MPPPQKWMSPFQALKDYKQSRLAVLKFNKLKNKERSTMESDELSLNALWRKQPRTIFEIRHQLF
jgi:hypothetical protein